MIRVLVIINNVEISGNLETNYESQRKKQVVRVSVKFVISKKKLFNYDVFQKKIVHILWEGNIKVLNDKK